MLAKTHCAGPVDYFLSAAPVAHSRAVIYTLVIFASPSKALESARFFTFAGRKS